MDHYSKGRNEEEQLTKDNIPIDNLPEKYGWCEVTGATKIRTDVGGLCKTLKEENALGRLTARAISYLRIWDHI